MKEKIDVNEYAGVITAALPKGILLNTNGEKFNSMVIGWGALGTCWSRPTFTVYVRTGRYTRRQLDMTQEFTISVPLDGPDANITKVCGMQSGRNVDKAAEAGLTLETPNVTRTPGVKEYPLTLECKVLYQQTQDLPVIPADILSRYYPVGVPGTEPMANEDAHVAYIGEIVDAYIIK